MAGPYQNFPHGFAGMFPPYFDDEGQGQQMMQPSNYYAGNQHFQPALESLATNFPEFEDPSRTVLPAQGSSRVRKRVGAAGEHVKFRRTRSGCYTCRNRRVKCDEARPTCERCRKGSRDCIYPEPSSSSKSRRGSNRSKSGEGDGSSQDEGEEGDDAILEEDESPTKSFTEPASATSTKAASPNSRALSDPPALTHGSSPTPSTEGLRSKTATPSLAATAAATKARLSSHKRWLELPDDIRFYLNYARTKLTRHHWGLKFDPSNFLGTTLIEVALKFEPLLYAVVGFAAYHYTLKKPDGRVQDFLGYYLDSVRLLRESLKKKKPTVATIFTVLQLASIEEYLGDWVNLMSHQKAAYLLITELYTPQSMMKNDGLRKTLLWYIRFDTFVGIMSGTSTQLGGDWFQAQYDFCAQQCKEHPNDLQTNYEERSAYIRVTGHGVSQLIRNKAQGAISNEEFNKEITVFANRVESFTSDMHPALTDPSKRIHDFSEGRRRDPDDIVDPYEPDLLYGGDIFDTNLLIADIVGFRLIFDKQLAAMQGRSDSATERNYALKMCQLFDAVQHYPDAPPGMELGMQAGMALAILFLHQDEKEIMWARRKIAGIEALGYNYPDSLRLRFEELWGVDLSKWWLPDEEGLPPLIPQIRNFVKTRPMDEKGELLRDMKGLFNALNLSDTSSPESAQQSPSANDRPAISRDSSSSKARMGSTHSDDFDFDAITAHGQTLVFGDSPEFEWG